MKKRIFPIILGAAFLILSALPAFPQSKGLDSIRGDDMKSHLEFLAAPEFLGRPTPSSEADIAARYIAVMAEKIGLKPLLPEGYFQPIPAFVTSIRECGSFLKLTAPQGGRTFEFLRDFSAGRLFRNGTVSGNVVFLGYGLESSRLNWDDYAGLDLRGKIVVILNQDLPKDHVLDPEKNRQELRMRMITPLKHGAAAVLSVVDEDREKRLAEGKESMSSPRITNFEGVETDQMFGGSRFTAPIVQLELRHDAAAAILGISREDLARLFADVRSGRRPVSREIQGASLEISLDVVENKARTANVVGWIEGSDPNLKNEYVVIGSHYDHVEISGGKILPGADDNASGVVGMFEIAEAMMIERPKRSVIFVWHTAEEKGLIGAFYFVQKCPVPVEAISANLNLDMISRNPADRLYIIGAKTLSSELDKSLREANDGSVRFLLEAPYDDLAHPERFFFRSDHYPYIRYGIPGVWIFCGTTADYHQPGDVAEKCDFLKMEKVCKLTYLAAMDIGNKPALLKLDADPEITTRGKHNTKINWMQKSFEKAKP